MIPERKITPAQPTKANIEHARRQHRLEIDMGEEKAGAVKLLAAFHKAVKAGGLHGLEPLPFVDVVELFRLGSAYGNTQLDDLAVSGDGYMWDFTHTLDQFGATVQKVVCQQLHPHQNLLVIERRGQFSNSGIRTSDSADIFIKDPERGGLRGSVEISERGSLIKLHTDAFRFGKKDIVTADMVGRFNHRGEFAQPITNFIDRQKVGEFR